MTATHTNDKLLSLPEVADLLGLSVATLYRWRSLGEGPRGYRLQGGQVRYRRADVDVWLESQADEPRDPVQPVA